VDDITREPWRKKRSVQLPSDGLTGSYAPNKTFNDAWLTLPINLAEAMSFLLLPIGILVTVGQAVWLR
jgi:hypothetical protein